MKKRIVVFLVLFFNYTFAKNPLTDSNYFLAYKELQIVNYAREAYDLDNRICNYLSSSESFDKKMAVVDAFNSSAEMQAGNLFFIYLKHKYNIVKVEEIQNKEEQLILSYLYFTSDLNLSKTILKNNEKFINQKLSYALLEFLINSMEQIEFNECKVWTEFQKLDNAVYKFNDMKAEAITILAKSIDKLKSKCSNEQLVITKTKRYFISEKAVNRFNLKNENGVYKINLNINKSVSLDFVLDSGASVVLIPEDVFSVLVRNGTILKSDIIGKKTFTIADGTSTKLTTFIIKSLTLGTITVTNIEASIGRMNSDLLLGQSFIKKFKSIKINNLSNELIIETK